MLSISNILFTPLIYKKRVDLLKMTCVVIGHISLSLFIYQCFFDMNIGQIDGGLYTQGKRYLYILDMWGRVCTYIYMHVLARTLLYMCAVIICAASHLYMRDSRYDNLYIYDQYVHRCIDLFINVYIWC